MIVFLLILSIIQASNVGAFEPRLSNGLDSFRGEFKSFAVITWRRAPFFKYVNVAGGTIISPFWILTAASVVEKCPTGFNIRVHVGHVKNFDNLDGVQVYDIVKKIPHEGHKKSLGENDIALFKTNDSIKMNYYVEAAHLPEKNAVYTGQLMITGWGQSKNAQFDWERPKVAQKAVVSVYSDSLCQWDIDEEKLDVKLTSSQMCTYSPDKSITACFGDGGAPLIDYIDAGVGGQVVVGIISWVFQPCGRYQAPTISTKVSHFIDWIRAKQAQYA